MHVLQRLWKHLNDLGPNRFNLYQFFQKSWNNIGEYVCKNGKDGLEKIKSPLNYVMWRHLFDPRIEEGKPLKIKALVPLVYVYILECHS